jgi:hypothetical protein
MSNLKSLLAISVFKFFFAFRWFDTSTYLRFQLYRITKINVTAGHWNCMDNDIGNTWVTVLEICDRKLDFVRLTRKPSFQSKKFHFSYPFFFSFGATALSGPRASSFTNFLDRTQWRTTFGRTHLDEWSARRTDFYLKTHNIHNRQTSMPPGVFEPTILGGERPQAHVLGRAATGTGFWYLSVTKFLRQLKERQRTLIKLMNDYLISNFWHIIQILTCR